MNAPIRKFVFGNTVLRVGVSIALAYSLLVIPAPARAAPSARVSVIMHRCRILSRHHCFRKKLPMS